MKSKLLRLSVIAIGLACAFPAAAQQSGSQGSTSASQGSSPQQSAAGGSSLASRESAAGGQSAPGMDRSANRDDDRSNWGWLGLLGLAGLLGLRRRHDHHDDTYTGTGRTGTTRGAA